MKGYQSPIISNVGNEVNVDSLTQSAMSSYERKSLLKPNNNQMIETGYFYGYGPAGEKGVPVAEVAVAAYAVAAVNAAVYANAVVATMVFVAAVFVLTAAVFPQFKQNRVLS